MAKTDLQKFVEQTNSRPWRETWAVHPAAEIFPQLPPDEMRKLAADIKANGVQVAVVLRSSGRRGQNLDELIDGRNRLDAMAMARVPLMRPDGSANFPVHILEDGEDPYDAVVSHNITRRHLTTPMKQALIDKLVALNPTRSNRQIGELAKVDHKTVSVRRKKLEAAGEIPQVNSTIGADGKSRPVNRSPSDNLPRVGRASLDRLNRLRSILFRMPPDRLGQELVKHPPETRAALFALLPPSQRAQWEAELTAALPAASPALLKSEPEATSEKRHWSEDPVQNRRAEVRDLVEQFWAEHDDETVACFIAELAARFDARSLRRVIGWLGMRA